MISVNSVYDTVLAIINKEQRGYLTPTEFNKFAKQAQLEIFEADFADLAHFTVSRKGMSNQTGYSDTVENLEEKIDVFSETAQIGAVPSTDISYDSTSGRFTLPTNLYRLDTVLYIPSTGARANVEKMNKMMETYILGSSKLAPDTLYPKYTRIDDKLKVYPTTIVADIEAHYIREPLDPIWNSISFGGNPLYNAASSQDFELHVSHEYLLVEKILLYTGISIREPLITQVAAQDIQADNINKKS